VPFEKFLEQRIFQALGMKDSFIFPPADKINRIAMLYDLENGKLLRAGPEVWLEPLSHRQGTKYPGQSVPCTHGIDLFAFYQMMLNSGTQR
jgi:CubicO group peptidase (beta-lactamase class C family)